MSDAHRHPASDPQRLLNHLPVGRLWQSLILCRLNPVFLHLPVEAMVHDNQDGYYQAINDSTIKNDSGTLIDFMLERILEALQQHQDTESGGANGGVNEADIVFAYIKEHPGLRANALSEGLSLPKHTLERHLGVLRKTDRIEFRGASKTGGYYVRK